MASDVASGSERDNAGLGHVASDSSAEVNDVQVEATAVKGRSVVWKYFKKMASQHGAKVQCEIAM